MKVQDKIIVVTGGGGGIGGELVLELLRRGAKVVAVDLREESLLAVGKQAGKDANNLSAEPLDITNKEAVEKLPERVIKEFGAIDGLINCAGIVQPFVRINNLEYDAIERVMAVNFYGTLYMTKAFLPELLKRPEAHIVNVSSMGGFLPVPGQSVYGASKAAIKLLTESLYAELLESPVRVSAVFPGATDTNITQNSNVAAPNISDEDLEKMKSQVLPAAKAAKIIVNGIERDKPLIYTGKDSKFMNKLYRLNPVLATKFIAKKMKALLGN